MHRTHINTITSSAADGSLGTSVVPTSNRMLNSARLQLLLVLGSSILLLTALAMFEPAAHWADDAELFVLLRGMASIKGLLAVLAFSAVWWRLGRSLSPRLAPRLAQTYIAGVWALALASGLIWQLTFIVAASGLFHLASMALLVATWRDAGPRLQPAQGNQQSIENQP
jgi:hypothetical protein